MQWVCKITYFNFTDYIMNTRKLFSILAITLIGSISKVYAVSAKLLRPTKDTAGGLDLSHSQVDGNYSVLDLISLVNKYLWFAIWFVCFLFMIINGYKLISANGDEKKTKEATSSLIWTVIWIVICLLAYIIVNIAVKLFAS